MRQNDKLQISEFYLYLFQEPRLRSLPRRDDRKRLQQRRAELELGSQMTNLSGKSVSDTGTSLKIRRWNFVQLSDLEELFELFISIFIQIM